MINPGDASRPSGINPWELSGLLCGALCAGADRNQASETTARHLASSETDVAALFKALSGHAADLEERLAAPGDLFEPDLPGEEASLSVRVGALASWCRGFELGLLHIADQQLNAGRLCAESREALQDISRYCHLDDESSCPDDPLEEDAFLQLVEYLRVAVALIHADLSVPQANNPPRRASEKLH